MQKIVALGLSRAEFARIARISFPTLQKIDAGDKSVRPEIVARAQNTLSFLAAENAGQTRGGVRLAK